jgi:tRNA pseudouridine65 synthase
MAEQAPDPIEVVYEDAELLAVNKPAGLLVHRSQIAADESEFLLDRLQQRADSPLFLAHRLDRATSGLVLLAKSREVAGDLGRQFIERRVDKRYLAVVRGWPQSAGEVDYPLPDVRDHAPRKPALTRWRVLATATVPIALGGYPEQRYALIEAAPITGRYRQIRKHFHHLSHPIVGDTSHGRGDHNRLWRMHLGVHRLLLHAWRLHLAHPRERKPLALEAAFDETWRGVLRRFGWNDAVGGVPMDNC